MKRNLRGLLACAVALVMAAGMMPAMAEDEYTTDFFDSATTAYGTDIEYIDDLGEYVIGGKSFYTSKDGVNWIRRAGAIADTKPQTYGFAYGGSSNNDEKYFMVILKNVRSDKTDGENKAMILDKYLASKRTVRTYTTGAGGELVPLYLKGGIEWDDYTGKFWCGASQANRLYSGLYYFDGQITGSEDASTLQAVWTKADTGVSALYKEDVEYHTETANMIPVFSNITSDGQGHIIAQGIWRQTTSTDNEWGNQVTGSGTLSHKSALFIDASDPGSYSCKALGVMALTSNRTIGYVGIDKYSNIIVQAASPSSTAAASRDVIRTKLFSDTAAVENGATLSGWKYMYDEYPSTADENGLVRRTPVNQNGANAGVIGKMLSLDDSLVLIPRGGFGASSGEYEDVLIANYNKANANQNTKFFTYINNPETVASIFGTSATMKVVTDAAIGPDGKIAILTGGPRVKGSAVTSGTAQVTIIDTKDPVADTETGYFSNVTRNTAEYVKISSSIISSGNDYSHISATTDQRNTEVERDSYFELSSTVYDGLDAVAPHAAENVGAVTYEYVGNSDDIDGVFDISEINGDGIYVWDDAPEGTYVLNVKATLESQPMIENIISYNVTIKNDIVATVNSESFAVETGVALSQGLAAGDNIIAIKSNRLFTVSNYYTIVAVYNSEGRFVTCGISDLQNAPDSAECMFNIPGEDASGYYFKVFTWSDNCTPL